MAAPTKIYRLKQKVGLNETEICFSNLKKVWQHIKQPGCEVFTGLFADNWYKKKNVGTYATLRNYWIRNEQKLFELHTATDNGAKLIAHYVLTLEYRR